MKSKLELPRIDRLRDFLSTVFQKKRLLIVACILVLILAIALGYGSASLTSSRMTRFGLQDVGKLMTQSGYFTSVQVIEDAREIYGWKIPLTKSKSIFSYDGIVHAGIDFEKIELSVNELTHNINIILPDAEIFSLEVDPDSLKIYDESASIFTPITITDMNDSYSKLQEEVRTQAVHNGLLEAAHENAKVIVENFLSKSFDLTEYKVQFE